MGPPVHQGAEMRPGTQLPLHSGVRTAGGWLAEKPRPRPQPAFLLLREFGNPLSVGWSAWLASGPAPLEPQEHDAVPPLLAPHFLFAAS